MTSGALHLSRIVHCQFDQLHFVRRRTTNKTECMKSMKSTTNVTRHNARGKQGISLRRQRSGVPEQVPCISPFCISP